VDNDLGLPVFLLHKWVAPTGQSDTTCWGAAIFQTIILEKDTDPARNRPSRQCSVSLCYREESVDDDAAQPLMHTRLIYAISPRDHYQHVSP
jgi:hypothetical protein